MTIPLELIESDVWPAIRQKISEERERRLSDLLNVATIEEMRAQQGFIEALDWVVNEARPRRQPTENDEDDQGQDWPPVYRR